MKTFRLLVFRYFIKNLILKSPTTKAVIEPAKSERPKPVEKISLRISKSFFIPEPSKIGIDRRKLKRTASSFESPLKSPPEIVAPDLDTPGNKASTWKNPINTPLPIDNGFHTLTVFCDHALPF